jgi:ABC-type Na+ transport system ATPase subunit NatA
VAGVHLDPEQVDLAPKGVKVAVSDLTLAVERGTCLGLLGENGAGEWREGLRRGR